MVRTASASSQTGVRRDASAAVTTAPAAATVAASRSSKTQLNEVQDTDDKMEAPQAKRLKTEADNKPAKDEDGRTSTPKMPRTRSWSPSTSTTSLST